MGGVVNRRVNIDPTKILSRINFILFYTTFIHCLYIVYTLFIHPLDSPTSVYAGVVLHGDYTICRDMP